MRENTENPNRDIRSRTPDSAQHIQAMQRGDNPLRRVAQQYDEQRALAKPQKSSPQQIDQVREGMVELECIDTWLRMHKERLDRLSPPEITFSPRSFTQEEKATIKAISRFDMLTTGTSLSRPTRLRRFERIREAYASFNDPALPQTRHRKSRFKHFSFRLRLALNISKNQNMIEKLNELKSKCNDIYNTYKSDISQPFWAELKKKKIERDLVRRHLEDLDETRQVLQIIRTSASSNKSESSQALTADTLIKKADTLIKKARSHEAALCEKIKKGHQSLHHMSRKWKSAMHPFFLEEQMGEYQLEEGKVHISGNGCISDSIAMIINDIDLANGNTINLRSEEQPSSEPSSGFDPETIASRNTTDHYQEIAKKALLEYQKSPLGSFSPQKSVAYTEIPDLINELQQSVTYRLGYIKTKADLRQALTSEGKRIGIMAINLTLPLNRFIPTKHTIVIDKIKGDLVFILDSSEKNLTYSLRWDDLVERWPNRAIMPKPR